MATALYVGYGSLITRSGGRSLMPLRGPGLGLAMSCAAAGACSIASNCCWLAAAGANWHISPSGLNSDNASMEVNRGPADFSANALKDGLETLISTALAATANSDRTTA